MKKTTQAFGVDQIAYPVGPNKDGYYVGTHFYLDTETNLVTSKSIAFENFYSTTKCKQLHTGTYKECYDCIQQLIAPEDPASIVDRTTYEEG